MQEEGKQGTGNNGNGRRAFAAVVKGEPYDFQQWLDSARAYGLFVVYSKTSKKKLVFHEEDW